MQILILADDLTGANDTAIQFVTQGFSGLVVVRPELPEPSICTEYDIVSVNTDTRKMSGTDAYMAIRKLLSGLKTAPPKQYYKKVDSVLRGNPGLELGAVMDELAIPLAIAAPSFPANLSIVEGGILKSGTGISSAEINAVQRFAVSQKKTESIPLGKIRQGSETATAYILDRQDVSLFVADAVTDDDLETVYRISADLAKKGKNHILAGSAGLAGRIPRHTAEQHQVRRHTAGQNRIEMPVGSAPVLVLAGTRQEETAAQITALSRCFSVSPIRFKADLVTHGRTDEAIRLACAEASAQIKQNSSLCIIAVESMFRSAVPAGTVSWNTAEGNADSIAISAALGDLAARLIQTIHFPVMITAGGDTSLEVCNRLGIIGIRPLAEILPGIPIGAVVGGYGEPQYIITKSGRFGTEQTVVEILRFLGIEEKS